jgi:O-antigen/teichoic acid export membrane protein
MLVAGVVSVLLFGLSGMYVATAITLSASLTFLTSVGGGRFRWHWDSDELRHLATIGTPILLIAIGTTATRSLDRWMILGFSDDRELELGLYSVALLMTTQIAGLANVFAIVMGPRYGELLGNCGDRSAVARLAARITEIKASAMALSGLVALTLGPSMLVLMLPGYEAGLAAMIVRVPGAVARALAVPANQLMITVDQQRRALLALGPPTIIGVTLAWVSYQRGWGLIGIAWAMTLSDLAYLLVLSVMAFRTLLSFRQRARYVLALLAGTLPLLGIAAFRSHAQLGTESVYHGGLLLVIAVSIWLCVATLGWYLGGWSQLWRKEPPCAE